MYINLVLGVLKYPINPEFQLWYDIADDPVVLLHYLISCELQPCRDIIGTAGATAGSRKVGDKVCDRLTLASSCLTNLMT